MFVITGATGHIGNNLLRIMLAAGEDVKILLRKNGEAVEGLDVEKAFGDIFDPEFLARNLSRGDVLLHLAATIDLSNRNPADTLRVNFEGTKKIAGFCAEHGVRLVFVSSVDAINKPLRHGPIAEPESFDPDLFKNGYARSKALATAHVDRMLQDGSLRGCILYPSAVVGVNDFKPSAAGREIVRACGMKIAFYIRGGYDFIDVRDVARAIYRAAKTNYGGSCILAAHDVTVRDLYRLIRKINGRKLVLIRVPVLLARLGGLFMKGFSGVMIDALQENYAYDNTRMRKDLLPETIPFETTLADTIDWFRTRGRIL